MLTLLYVHIRTRLFVVGVFVYRAGSTRLEWAVIHGALNFHLIARQTDVTPLRTPRKTVYYDERRVVRNADMFLCVQLFAR